MNIEISQETKNNDEGVKLRTEEGIKDALKKRNFKKVISCLVSSRIN